MIEKNIDDFQLGDPQNDKGTLYFARYRPGKDTSNETYAVKKITFQAESQIKDALYNLSNVNFNQNTNILKPYFYAKQILDSGGEKQCNLYLFMERMKISL